MKILVTGAAGFIGSNVTDALLKAGHYVVGVDNLSREGVFQNLFWILLNNKRFKFFQYDIRDREKMEYLTAGMDAIFHFAAQVGVTQSIKEPREDFDINVGGTINLLEGARMHKREPFFVFSSTNKVYGHIEDDKPVALSQPLDFQTPYGCSKGAAEQYIMDYGRMYGIKSVVLRMSCIYGQRQYGTEEQGWLAHFMFSHYKKEPITIYGDGTQRRDALHIEDFKDLCLNILSKDTGYPIVFNIGGGPKNTISVNEALKKMRKMVGDTKVSFDDWRPADQHTYISDISRAKKDLKWEPQVDVDEGLERLLEWVKVPK